MKSEARNPKPEAAAPAHRSDTIEAYTTSVERAIRHMKANLAKPLDLNRLAQTAAISKFHFVRVFDEVTGTTPLHFLACLRMQRAKELLLTTAISITDTCLEVGYTSLGSFSTTFSELVGVSPQEFRAMPKRLTTKQFATAIWRYLASRRGVKGPTLEGVVEGSSRPRGFTFVGTFTSGVPLGVPFSGTVMVSHGRFVIERPPWAEFHLLAALLPLSANLTETMASLPVGLIASRRMSAAELEAGVVPHLRLRPVRPTDPPIVLALPALPPLRV